MDAVLADGLRDRVTVGVCVAVPSVGPCVLGDAVVVGALVPMQSHVQTVVADSSGPPTAGAAHRA